MKTPGNQLVFSPEKVNRCLGVSEDSPSYVAGRPRAGAWGSIARPRKGLELVDCGDATGEIDSSPDEEVSTRDIVKTSGPDAA